MLVLLTASLFLFCVRITAASSLEAQYLSQHRTRSFYRDLSDEEDDDENESLEEPNKYQPNKYQDIRCEHYSYYNQTQQQSQNGYGNGGGYQYGRPSSSSSNGTIPPPPCREQPPRPPPSSTNGPSDNSQPSREELLKSTVVINVSVALPKAYQDGIPNRLTTAVKEYLKQPNVTKAFRQLDYNGTHFDLKVWKQPPPGENIEDSDSSSDENNSDRKLQQTTNNNTPVLGLVALKDSRGYYIGDILDTKYAWVHHTVYLVAHEGDEFPKGQRVQDPDLMEWLRVELQQVIYQDLRLEGPLRPYYDTNNIYQDSENYHERQISFLEWTLQSYGIPIRGMVEPGSEFWHDEAVAPSKDDSDREVFDHPISTNYISTRQWMGVFCLVTTVVTTMTLATIASQIAKRREQEELWGINVRMMESIAREDADYLNVGWRFADHNHHNADAEAPTMVMEVYDKRGVGYQDDNSLLMGGFEYKPKSNRSIVGGPQSQQ